MKSGGRGQSLLLTMLLIAAMMLLPQRAWAQESYGFSIGGTQVTSENIQEFKGVSFSDGILSLEGANLTGGLEVDWNTFANSGFKINITGENTIAAATEGSAISSNSESATIALTFSGTGKLTLTNDGTYPLTSGFTVSFQDNLGTSASLTSREIETATISTMYNLFVAGTRVSEVNKGDVFGDGKVSFNPETYTLTLNAVSLTNTSTGAGALVNYNGVENITINLIGENIIDAASKPAFAFIGTNPGGKFTFTTDASSPGSLVISNCTSEASGASGDYLAYENGLQGSYENNPEGTGAYTVEVPTVNYGLMIGDWPVTNKNCSNIDGKYQFTFDPGTSTLTVTNFEDTSVGVQTSLEALTIKVSGTNQLGAIRYSGQHDSSTLTFVKDEQSEEGVCSLALNGSYNGDNPIEESAISGFTSVNYGEGMSLSAAYGTEYSESGYLYNSTISSYVEYVSQVTITSADVYQLWYNSKQVTSENIQQFKGVSFSDGILSLENAYFDGVLQTSLAELTIKVTGSNNHFGGIRYSGKHESSTLTFVKDDQAEGVCSLTLSSTDYAAISGFTTVSYGTGMSLAAAYGTKYSESGYLYNSTISSYVEYVYYATITSADVYQLWYNSEQVTSENAATLEYDDNSVTASFDVTTSTLTFNNLGGGYGGHAVISNMGKLNVYLIGENSMNGESQSLFYTASQSAKINFQTSEATPGSLAMQGMVEPFEGFGEGNITYENDLKYSLTQDTSELETYIATIQVQPYGLVIFTEGHPDGVAVTKQNRTNVLGDQKTPTVQFDGRSRLVLNGAKLTKILVGSSAQLPEDGLEIYLEGANTITNTELVAIQSEIATHQIPLSFLTAPDASGSLTYNYTGSDATLTDDTNLFTGFSVTYKNNLVKAVDFQNNKATIAIPLQLIVETTEENEDYSFNTSPAGSPTAKLDNFVYDDKVLFTIADNGTAGSPDGFDGNAIVINSVMTDTGVASTDNLIPGTPDYASAFKGLTFIVPAGKGVITLNVHTKSGFAFHVRIGEQPPVEVVNANGYADVEVPFACSMASYVKVYLVSTTTPAPAYDGHRAGPKASVSGGIGGLKVSSSSIVTPSVDPAAAYLLMDPSSDIATGSGSKYGVVVSNANVTDLPDDAFSSHKSASYIDLSGTKITGKHFSRVDGAFDGVNENTLIYLPAGNTATGANFIIGGICDDMRLKDDAGYFEAAANFTAAKADFNRSFSTGTDARGNASCYTVFLPYAIQPDKANGTFYTFTDYNAEKGTVNLNVVATPAANTAYIFQPAGDGAMKPMLSVEVSAAGSTASPDASSESKGLYGVYEEHTWTSAPDGIYCFVGDAKDGLTAGQFAKVGAGTHIRPFRAYLRIASTSAPEFLSVDWGNGTTSIVPLDKSQLEQSGEGWWTITGFRLPSKPTEKGVYIHNNKKVVVK